MKLNWAFGIAAFYISFMAILLFFVFKSTTYDNSLVMDNYYEQDLKYQEHYNRMVNSQKLGKKVIVHYDKSNKIVQIHFPKGMQNIQGTVQLYKPSTSHHDITKQIKVNDEATMHIPATTLSSGRWKVKINWSANHTDYYSENEIFL
ncbi:MAG TPA: hypothetical protein ENJ45_02485 [Phaeodactylibacter sp.]|nr:hypothetical protein [Phaeodactylibacter sp.]